MQRPRASQGLGRHNLYHNYRQKMREFHETYVVSFSECIWSNVSKYVESSENDYIMTHVNNYNKCWTQISNFFAVSGKVMVPAVRSWPQITEAGVVMVGWTIMDRQEEIILSRGRGHPKLWFRKRIHPTCPKHSGLEPQEIILVICSDISMPGMMAMPVKLLSSNLKRHHTWGEVFYV